MSDGGNAVTHYKVECNATDSFDGGTNRRPAGFVIISANSLGGVPDVQLITVRIDVDGMSEPLPMYFLSGTFLRTFDGQTSSQLPYNASAEDVSRALLKLCTVNSVSVLRSIHCSDDADAFSRCMNPPGYTWLVTFESLPYPGDQHHRPKSTLSAGWSHKLQVDGTLLHECADLELMICTNDGFAKAYIGSTPKMQRIVTESSDFMISLAGRTSDLISATEPVRSLESKMNGVLGWGFVNVDCAAGCVDNALSAGATILVTFLSRRGNVPLLIVSNPTAVVSEANKGVGQPVVGRLTYSVTVRGLTSTLTAPVKCSSR